MKAQLEALASPGSLARRQLLMRGLFGAGFVGLRALATGIPASFLLRPNVADAEDACFSAERAQYLVLSTSALGDPVNCNVPGTYLHPAIAHPLDPVMAKTSLSLGGRAYDAAKPWAELPANLLAQTCFFHHATLTNNHANQSKVMRLMGATRRQEMLVSMYAKNLAACLGTIQHEPLVVGAVSAGELLSYEGRTLPKLSPSGLRSVLLSPTGPLTKLQSLRDSGLDRMNALFKEHGTNAQRAFLDRMALSQREARAISQQLLDGLAVIRGDDAANQMLAAALLIKMNVSPVVSVRLPFGGDNHRDPDLKREATETVTSLTNVAALFQKCNELGLADKVTFASMNVFGRTLSARGTAGRDHLANHHVTVMIGKHVRPGVVGGLALKGNEFAAQAIDSKTGAGVATGDIPFEETLGAVGKTLGTALGLSPTVLDENITTGKVVQSVTG